MAQGRVMPRPKLAHSKAGREIEQRAYHRAADLAKSYAEHWEGAAKDPTDEERSLASLKAGHWRIPEKTIRDLAQ
jgi:hypothetical protein